MRSNNSIRQRQMLLIAIAVLAVLLIVLAAVAWRTSTAPEDPLLSAGETTAGSAETAGESGTEESLARETDGTNPQNQQTASGNDQTEPGNSGISNEPTIQTPVGNSDSEKLTCDEFALFSGQFVEDGRDELVEDVASILVTNRSQRFLDLATITYDIDGQTATFVVTGLPPGRSAWVMESSRMTATQSAKFTYVDSVTSFRDDVVASTEKIAIKADGNMLTATNNTDQTLENVCVYYRNLHTDGNFFGGITYVVSFGTLEPGMSAEKLAGHYSAGTTEIVRVGWQDG